jgi:hypothetical protein
MFKSCARDHIEQVSGFVLILVCSAALIMASAAYPVEKSLPSRARSHRNQHKVRLVLLLLHTDPIVADRTRDSVIIIDS